MRFFLICLLFICCSEELYVRDERPAYLIGKWIRHAEIDSTFLTLNINGDYHYKNISPNQTNYQEEGLWVVKYLDESGDKILNGTENKQIMLQIINSSNPSYVGKITYVTYDFWEQETKFLTIHLNINNKLYFQEDTTGSR